MDIIFVKACLASLALVLAIVQVLLMLQLYGKIRIFPGSAETLAWWHRREGDVLLLIFVAIAYHCIVYGVIDPFSSRVISHAVFGSVLLAVILFKIVVVRWLTRVMPYVAWIGSALFVLTTGAVLTSAGYYFYLWWAEGIRIIY
jgi:hypothetical protein